MDLRQLYYFVNIAQTGSMTVAASKVWVSQSALSRQMKLLEQDLGVSLFDRRARGVRLTEAGEDLFAHATALLKQAQDIKNSLVERAEEAVGLLRVGAPTSLQNMLVAPFAVHFKKEHPKVQLWLREGTSHGMRDALAQGQCDLVVVSTLEQMTPFEVLPLASEQLFLVGSVQARLALGKPATLRSVAAKPLVLTAHPNGLRVALERGLAKKGLSVEPVAQAESVSMMLALIQRGMGYAVLPYCAIHEALQARLVTACPIRDLRFSWAIAYSKERALTQAIRLAGTALRDIVRARVREEGVWLTAKLQD